MPTPKMDYTFDWIRRTHQRLCAKVAKGVLTPQDALDQFAHFLTQQSLTNEEPVENIIQELHWYL